MISFFIYFCMEIPVNSVVDPDQMPHSVAPDQGLHCMYNTPQGSKISFRQTCPAGQVLPKIHSSLRKIYLPCFSGVKMKKL